MENKKEKESKEGTKTSGLGWLFYGIGFLVMLIFRLVTWGVKALIESLHFLLGMLIGKKKIVKNSQDFQVALENVVSTGANTAEVDSSKSKDDARSTIWRQFVTELESEYCSDSDGVVLSEAVVGTFRLGFAEVDGRPVIKRSIDMPRSLYDHEKWRRDRKSGEIMERVHLSDYTELTAKGRSRNFSMEDAYALTKQEVKRVWDSFKKRNWVTQEIVTTQAALTPEAIKPALALKPVVETQSSQQVEEEDVASNSSSYAGEVISAHRVEVRPEGKKPYQIFQVVLQTDKGKEELNGKDLEIAFNEQKFALGSTVQIVKSKRSYELSQGGSVKQRYKNVFTISVLK